LWRAAHALFGVIKAVNFKDASGGKVTKAAEKATKGKK